MAFDYKKEYKEFYMPKNKPSIVTVPSMNYIAVCGQGDPNTEDGEYKQAIGLLYGIAFTIKMSKKSDYQIEGYFDYVVPPLEGFWWQDGVDGIDYAHKENFKWISVIRLPDFVTKEDFEWAVEEATKKKKTDFSKVEFFTYDEGECVQCMHIGSYDDEPATVALMHEYMESQGYVLDITDKRLHHEIYLSDARKVAPEKLKTVIRHPIRKAQIMKQLKEKDYEEFQQYLYNKAHGYIWTPDTLELICGGNNNEPERIGKQMLEMMGRMRNKRIFHMTSDKHKKYVIRSLRNGETELLKDFLYEAIFIPKGAEPPARDIIEKPELRVYTDEFGTRKGDNCLVADFVGKVVGAVWTRIMDDYGHVDDETPSFAISLYKEYRGQGIGSQLMVKMLELLKWQGYERASLAVQKANYAVKMYRNVGFKTIDENAEEYIMVCEL